MQAPCCGSQFLPQPSPWLSPGWMGGWTNTQMNQYFGGRVRKQEHSERQEGPGPLPVGGAPFTAQHCLWLKCPEDMTGKKYLARGTESQLKSSQEDWRKASRSGGAGEHQPHTLPALEAVGDREAGPCSERGERWHMRRSLQPQSPCRPTTHPAPGHGSRKRTFWTQNTLCPGAFWGTSHNSWVTQKDH